jgi:hypothetical protein
MMLDDEIINDIAIRQALSNLLPEDRDLISLVYNFDRPEDYEGPWPATLSHIGEYIGRKYKGRPLAEATVRLRRDAVLRSWAQARERGESPEIAGNRRKSKNSAEESR